MCTYSVDMLVLLNLVQTKIFHLFKMCVLLLKTAKLLTPASRGKYIQCCQEPFINNDALLTVFALYYIYGTFTHMDVHPYGRSLIQTFTHIDVHPYGRLPIQILTPMGVHSYGHSPKWNVHKYRCSPIWDVHPYRTFTNMGGSPIRDVLIWEEIQRPNPCHKFVFYGV